MHWSQLALNILKAELTRRGMSYNMLQDKLLKIDVEETANNLNVKINRGAFSFAFFLQCAKAMGIQNLRFDELIPNKMSG